MLHKIYPQNEIVSVLLMVVGALVAGWGDLTFDFVGYSLTLFNCVVTASYLLYIASKSAETKLNSWSLMYYNNVLSLLPVLAIAYMTEFEGVMNYPLYNSVGFWVRRIAHCTTLSFRRFRSSHRACLRSCSTIRSSSARRIILH